MDVAFELEEPLDFLPYKKLLEYRGLSGGGCRIAAGIEAGGFMGMLILAGNCRLNRTSEGK